ncbi:MAG: phage tail assembly protein [Kistimonas sp.]|nr:phage tail assembly protein [Kistimonas sp.]
MSSTVARETIQLTYPILSDGVETDTLHIRRPKVSDMLAAEGAKGSEARKEINMFATLCEVSPAAIEELDLKDYRQLQKAYESFLS